MKKTTCGLFVSGLLLFVMTLVLTVTCSESPSGGETDTFYIYFHSSDGASVVGIQGISEGESENLSDYNLTRTGYNFIGWSTSTNDTTIDYERLELYTMGSSSFDLYAVWEPKPTHDVIFHPNGGSGTMDNLPIIEGLSTSLPENDFSNSDMTLIGWGLTDSAVSVAFDNEAVITMGTSDIELYAMWGYTVTYNANGGTGTMDDQVIRENLNYTLESNDFFFEGKIFTGWSDDPSATNAEYLDNDTMASISEDLDLYAVWVSYGTVESLPYILNREVVKIPSIGTSVTFTEKTGASNSFSHTVSAFYMGKYEVTYELWYTVRQWALSNGYDIGTGREGNDGTIGSAPTASSLHQPVQFVTWRDCIVWCNAYSEMSGLDPVYYTNSGFTTPLRDSFNLTYSTSVDTSSGSFDNPYVDWSATGYRLPTEGEWQCAASNKGSTVYDAVAGDSMSYLTSSNINNYAWWAGNAYMVGSSHANYGTHPVGEKNANALGLYDMSGNSYEWCWDWSDSLPITATTDYRGPTSVPSSPADRYRVLRGGDWQNPNMYLTVGNRDEGSPSFWYGFRVSKTY